MNSSNLQSVPQSAKQSGRIQKRKISYGLAMGIEIALTLALICVWLFSGLSPKITSTQSFDTVSEKIISALDPALYPRQNRVSLQRYFGLDPDNYLGSVVLRKNDALSPNELVLVEFDNEDAGAAFEAAMEKRRDDQIRIYTGYAPESAEITKNALLDVQGNYGLYYVGDNPAQIDALFQESLRG